MPSEGRGNDGYDNENNDLILTVNDVLVASNRRYVASERIYSMCPQARWQLLFGSLRSCASNITAPRTCSIDRDSKSACRITDTP